MKQSLMAVQIAVPKLSTAHANASKTGTRMQKAELGLLVEDAGIFCAG